MVRLSYTAKSMAETPPVLVDMDGVLADFDAEVLARVGVRYPQIPLLGERQKPRIRDDYPEYRELVHGVALEEGFFASLSLVDEALEGWQRILDAGYHPRVCSSPILANPYCQGEKLAWLDAHLAPIFGKAVVDEAIITREKYLQNGIAQIDDSPTIQHEEQAVWQHIMFDAPYNQSATEHPRLYGWLDGNLPALLDAAAHVYGVRA